MRIRSTLRGVIPLFSRLYSSYHIYNLMQEKEGGISMAKCSSPLFHLIVEKVKQRPFDERILMVLVTDCLRQNIPFPVYTSLFDYVYSRLHETKNINSMVNLLVAMFTFKQKDPDKAYQIGKKFFELYRSYETDIDEGSSYVVLRAIVGLEYQGCLHMFSNQQYSSFPFKKYKLINICFVLELFYKRKIEAQYPFLQKLIDLFIKNEKIVPFADVHHLNFAVRTIKDRRFVQCVHRIKKNVNNEGPATNELIPAKEGAISFDTKSLFQKEILSKYLLK